MPSDRITHSEASTAITVYVNGRPFVFDEAKIVCHVLKQHCGIADDSQLAELVDCALKPLTDAT